MKMEKLKKGILKIKVSQTEEEQKLATLTRRATAIDTYFVEHDVKSIFYNKDKIVYINPKPKKSNFLNTHIYAFNERDYQKLNSLLCNIATKEASLKAQGYNLEGVKSFNRNVWLDFSRESNAIEGIIADFPFDLLDFRVKLKEQIDTDPKTKDFDQYEYYKYLSSIDNLFVGNDAKNKDKGMIVVKGKTKYHILSPELMRQFIGFKYAYKCAKQDRYKHMKSGTIPSEEQRHLDANRFVEFILQINSLISGNPFTRFRNSQVYVKGANWVPPNEDLVIDNLDALCDFFVNDRSCANLNPIEKAAILHAEFIRIHPFMDGNGRTGRILANYSLIKDEMPTVSIRYNNTKEYFKALDKAIEQHEIDDLISIYYDGVCSSATKIWDCLNYIEKTQKPQRKIEESKISRVK